MNELETLEDVEAPARAEGLTEADLEYIRAIEGLTAEQWEKLEPAERLEALQELEDKLAEIQGRPPYPVVAEYLPCNRNELSGGYFDGDRIVVNRSLLEGGSAEIEALVEEFGLGSSREFIVNTLAHEGRHAYQWYAVENPGVHPNEHEVEYWRANFETYLQSGLYGFEAYWMQPLEVDARRYGDAVAALFDGTPALAA